MVMVSVTTRTNDDDSRNRDVFSNISSKILLITVMDNKYLEIPQKANFKK